MAMNVGYGGGNTPLIDINTTPLIDVMLVLIVSIIYVVPPMTHAVKLDMPQVHAPPPTHTKPEVVLIEIDFDNTILWNGRVVSGIEGLERYLRFAAAQPVQPELHLHPDRRAKYDVVVKVLAAAQRNHMRKMGFVNTPQFRD